METSPASAVAIVEAKAAGIQSIKLSLLEEIRLVEQEPQLSRIGRDQKQLMLRREARQKAQALADAAFKLIDEAERGASAWTLEAHLMRQEFSGPASQVDWLQRNHFALILPRCSVAELKMLMAEATSPDGAVAWRANMIRREIIARNRDGALIADETAEVQAITDAAKSLIPFDAKAQRDALPRLRYFGGRIQTNLQEIGGLAA